MEVAAEWLMALEVAALTGAAQENKARRPLRGHGYRFQASKTSADTVNSDPLGTRDNSLTARMPK
jgi:hypothetical protein